MLKKQYVTMTEISVQILTQRQQKNLKFNVKKMQLRIPWVKYTGIGYLTKVYDRSQTKSLLLSICQHPQMCVAHPQGWQNYLSQFIPQLADVCEPVRSLTLKDSAWLWEAQHSKPATILRSVM